MKSIYLIGSLRNPAIPEIGRQLRDLGFDVFDDWHAAGPEADDYWQKYEKSRGHRFDQALKNYPAQHVFAFDKFHLDRCDLAVLILPAGKSGHLELGYFLGSKKKGYILFDGVPEPERFDVMYNFANGVYFSREELFQELKKENQIWVSQTKFHAQLSARQMVVRTRWCSILRALKKFRSFLTGSAPTAT